MLQIPKFWVGAKNKILIQARAFLQLKNGWKKKYEVGRYIYGAEAY